MSIALPMASAADRARAREFAQQFVDILLRDTTDVEVNSSIQIWVTMQWTRHEPEPIYSIASLSPVGFTRRPALSEQRFDGLQALEILATCVSTGRGVIADVLGVRNGAGELFGPMAFKDNVNAIVEFSTCWSLVPGIEECMHAALLAREIA